VHITIGNAQLAAAASITQRVEIMRGKGAPRLRRLCALLDEFLEIEEPSHPRVVDNFSAFGRDIHDSDNVDTASAETIVDSLGAATHTSMFAMLGSESGSDDENGLGDGNCMQHREAEPATLPRGDAVATGEVIMCGSDSDSGIDPCADSDSGEDPCSEVLEAGPAEGAELHKHQANLARVMVFVLFKKEATQLADLLIGRQYPAAALQGGMGQRARDIALDKFRSGEVRVLVATDVAARGLDVGGVSHVINYSIGLSIDMYVHRVGRCGRAGRPGVAHTFVIDGDESRIGGLVEILDRNRQEVCPELRQMAAAVEKGELQQAPDSMGDAEEDLTQLRTQNRDRQREANAKKKEKQTSDKQKKHGKRK